MIQTSIYGERKYVRVLANDAVYIDFRTLCAILDTNSTTIFRMLKKMEIDTMVDESGQKIIFKYLNRIYYLESFAFTFWKIVGKNEPLN